MERTRNAGRKHLAGLARRGEVTAIALTLCFATLAAGCGGGGSDTGGSSAPTTTTTLETTGAGGEGGGGPWSCLGAVEWASPKVEHATVTYTVVDFLSEVPFPGVAVRACTMGDPDCAAPLAQGTTDSMGRVVLSVPTGATGWDGFAEITGVGPHDALFHPPWPVAKATEMTIFLLASKSFDLMMNAIGQTPLPGRGHVIFLADDCSFIPAAGVSASADSADTSSVTAYLKGPLPSTAAMATDKSGGGGILNLPAGTTFVTGTLAATGQRVGSREVVVRAGWISAINVLPTP